MMDGKPRCAHAQRTEASAVKGLAAAASTKLETAPHNAPNLASQ